MLTVLCGRNQREKGCRRVTAPSLPLPVYTKAKCFCDDLPKEDRIQDGEGEWDLGGSSCEHFLTYSPTFLNL